MKKEELIKMISELPNGCEIGTIVLEGLRVESAIEILTKQDKIYCNGTEITIEEIESARISNLDYICDYYIY